MSLPSVVTLMTDTFTAAVTGQQYTTITGLAGVTAMTIEATFAGTGGSTAVAIVRTRMNSGTTWREVARFDFSAAGSKWASLTAAAAGVAALSTLSADSVLNGFLGSEYQVIVTTTGTWVGGLLTVTAHAR